MVKTRGGQQCISENFWLKLLGSMSTWGVERHQRVVKPPTSDKSSTAKCHLPQPSSPRNGWKRKKSLSLSVSSATMHLCILYKNLISLHITQQIHLLVIFINIILWGEDRTMWSGRLSASHCCWAQKLPVVLLCRSETFNAGYVKGLEFRNGCEICW